MKELFVVFGKKGTYEDYMEWPVKAYLEEPKAKAHAVLCNERIKELLDEVEKEVGPVPTGHGFIGPNIYWTTRSQAMMARSKDQLMLTLDPTFDEDTLEDKAYYYVMMVPLSEN